MSLKMHEKNDFLLFSIIRLHEKYVFHCFSAIVEKQINANSGLSGQRKKKGIAADNGNPRASNSQLLFISLFGQNNREPLFGISNRELVSGKRERNGFGLLISVLCEYDICFHICRQSTLCV